MINTHAPGHTRKVFDNSKFQKLVDDCEKRILEIKKEVDFNTLAASGHSGIVLLGALGYILGMPILAVRRAIDETRHDNVIVDEINWDVRPRMVNGTFSDDTRYLIIDDLIDSGSTVDRIIRNIKSEAEFLKVYSSCAGCLLYDSSRDIYVSVAHGPVRVFNLERP